MTWRRPAMSRGFRRMRRSGLRLGMMDGSGLLFRSFLGRLFRSRLLRSFLGSLLGRLLGRLLHGLLRGFFRRLLRGFFSRLLGGFLGGEKLLALLRLLAFLLLRFSHVVLLLR